MKKKTGIVSEKNAGYILLHRKIREHWIWKDAVKLKWWLDILMECNHADQKVTIGFTMLECARGESLNSLQTWALKWAVDVSSVRRFFKLLEDDAMIVLKNEVKTTRITVCNYDDYNGERQAKQSQSNSKTIALQSRRNSDAIQTKNELINEERSIPGADAPVYSPEQNEMFNSFSAWIEKYAPKVNQMKEPVSIKQFLKLKTDFPGTGGKELIQEILLAMHNKKTLLKDYESANLTLRSWIKLRHKREGESTKNNQSNGQHPSSSVNDKLKAAVRTEQKEVIA